MKWRSLVLVGALAMAACSSYKPIPVASGDLCFRCQRPINDVRLAGQVIAKNGHAMKFKTPKCMATYIRDHKDDVAEIFVTDYSTGRMMKASRARFVPAMVGAGKERGQDYLAFGLKAEAERIAKREGTSVIGWEAVTGF
jgi:copper chaperone NosL